MKLRTISLPIIALFSAQIGAAACVITSNDDQLPIRICQPQIPDRSFDVVFAEECPSGAYGICQGAKSQGVAYEQAIHYYSDADDAPVLKAYCENISEGRWEAP